jgi:hypothetical protein
MRGRVDSERHPTHDARTCFGECTGKFTRDSDAISGRLAAPYDRDTRTRERSHVADVMKLRRRRTD